MYAGLEGRGAEDAWYSRALLSEACWAAGMDYSGASVELHKAFNRLPRRQVLAAALAAAFRGASPPPTLTAWTSSPATTALGSVWACRTSGDYQYRMGCPWSMSLLSRLLRPWVALRRTMAAVPRTLADDLSIHAEGLMHQPRLAAVLRVTRAFIILIGGTVTTGPASVPEGRAWLRAVRWPGVGSRVDDEAWLNGERLPVVLRWRDLGVRARTGGVPAASTLGAAGRRGRRGKAD